MISEDAATRPDALAGFAERFPGIQLRLHYERIAPGTATVGVQEITDRAALGDVFTAYRATQRQVEVSMKNPFARPMRIGDIAARLGEFPVANRQAFIAYRDRFAQEAGPITVDAPAYDLGAGRLLLLDGNHRATALFMDEVPFVLRLHVLSAPISRRVLIDLKYWDGGWRRFFNKSRPGTSADKARPAHRFP